MYNNVKSQKMSKKVLFCFGALLHISIVADTILKCIFKEKNL